MQVSCPSCSTAYEIPPPARPKRLRCARCDTEWRVLPPELDDRPAPSAAIAAPTVQPATIVDRSSDAPEPQRSEPIAPIAPVMADALGVPTPPRRHGAGAAWLLAWVASLAVIGGGVFAGWHGRASIEHVWPQTLWLFRLLPAGVPI